MTIMLAHHSHLRQMERRRAKRLYWKPPMATTLPRLACDERNFKMSRKSPVPKMIAWTSAAVVAFTAISIIVPVIWERVARKETREGR